MVEPSYPLLTERLLLRPFVADDLDALHAIQRRTDIARYLYISPRTRAQVREVLAERMTWTKLEKEGDALLLAVEERQSEAMIGDVILIWLSEPHRQGEIGYVFHPDVQGRGYATEASRVLLRIGFADLGLHRIIGRADARNRASTRVMEKLGMRHEAHFRENEFIKGEWTDEIVYAMLAAEWREREGIAGGEPGGSP